jgi:hypothetical protein
MPRPVTHSPTMTAAEAVIPNADAAPAPTAATRSAIAPALEAVPTSGPPGGLLFGRFWLLLALGLVAAGVVSGVNWCAGHLDDWRTTIGPDYVHTARDDAEARACTVQGPAYSQSWCVTYLQEDTAREAYRRPVAEGGVCPLASRFDCANRYGLEQHDVDVPLWLPWYLHNGPAGTGFTGTAGAVLGALVAAGIARLTRRPTAVRWHHLVEAAVAGALVGVAVFSLGRHTGAEYGIPALPTLAGLPGLLLVPAVTAATGAVLLGARPLLNRVNRSRRTGGAR